MFYAVAGLLRASAMRKKASNVVRNTGATTPRASQTQSDQSPADRWLGVECRRKCGISVYEAIKLSLLHPGHVDVLHNVSVLGLAGQELAEKVLALHKRDGMETPPEMVDNGAVDARLGESFLDGGRRRVRSRLHYPSGELPGLAASDVAPVDQQPLRATADDGDRHL